MPVATISEFYKIYERKMKDEEVADSLIGSKSTFTIAYDKVKDWLKLQGSPVSDYLLEKEPYL